MTDFKSYLPQLKTRAVVPTARFPSLFSAITPRNMYFVFFFPFTLIPSSPSLSFSVVLVSFSPISLFHSMRFSYCAMSIIKIWNRWNTFYKVEKVGLEVR